ncbi:leucine--tRNA ligase [Actinomyces urinae]|uniref:leucine--tRNA ligase n=1 Tax=Actinomyces urinae TaxID=1689268 RepID=UPI00093026A1|nr:class I tRNA ligase family protein [Actinomyces urinae]
METAGDNPYRYDAALAAKIEARWQQYWQENQTFAADNREGDLEGPLAKKEKFYLLDMFPYPSGAGLHVGHPLGYIATDTVARYKRMQDLNVLYTLGFDAFGLPAEQYAVQTGQHPRITTENNITNMRRQLARIGLSHDKRRSISTTDDEFVRWTQWIFLQIYNSWYDPQAKRRDGKVGSARPISELVAEFESGKRETPHKPWVQMSEGERSDLLDEYRLAYVAYSPVNWCPGLGTVLADEEVTADGRSERGNYPVFKSRLRQWMMRITAYADRLAEDLDTVDWPHKVVAQQRNWIGRSTGATVHFEVEEGQVTESTQLTVFTTRPDTLFGATFMVVAPEHELVGGEDTPAQELTVPSQWPAGTREEWTGGYASPREAVAAYRSWAKSRTDDERLAEGTEKTGVFTGIFGTNPVNGNKVPVFVADYVLMGYGTGAIMAVPAHDDRDFAFAQRFNIDVVTTIQPDEDFDGEGAWTGDGLIVNSQNDEISLNGLNKADAIARITNWLEEKGVGHSTVTYRLRDWLFSRQRYWGEPFPVVYDEDGRVHALPESMLPVQLPELDNFQPRTFDPDDADTTPEAALSRATDWIEVELDLGDGLKKYHRDTNTMPNWAGSSWYELRYTDPNNTYYASSEANEAYWMGPKDKGESGGADLYIGGVEHAVLHLLYARFWHKVLFDLGHVSSSEPFHKLFNQGYIQAYAFKDARGEYVPADEVEGDEETGWTYKGREVFREYGKMGKSLKNIVTPDDMCEEYGADTFRMYEMSMGPLEVSRPWDTRAVVGSYRFLQRLWRNVVDEETGAVTVTDEPADLETKKLVARTIADVTEEYENMRMNTAAARMIVLNNHLTGIDRVPREAIEPLVLMASPLAPHIAEELWNKLGHEGTLAREPFPVVEDESLLEEEKVTCVVQIAGKVRARLEVAPSISAEELEKLALETEAAVKALDGRDPLKVIVRAPKLVSIVLPK